MRYLKKHEIDMESLPSYNFKGFVYAPTVHNGRIYHTVFRNWRYVTDLYGPSNAVFGKKEFIDTIVKGFKRYGS